MFACVFLFILRALFVRISEAVLGGSLVLVVVVGVGFGVSGVWVVRFRYFLVVWLRGFFVVYSVGRFV